MVKHLHKYLADYINEERQRRQPITSQTVSDAIEAFENGAHDGEIRNVIVSDNSKVSEIELTVVLCLEYLIDSEADDFLDNPSIDHVYYHAYQAKHGYKDAQLMFKQAIKKQNKEPDHA